MTDSALNAMSSHGGRGDARLSLIFGLAPFLFNAIVNLSVRAIFGAPEAVSADAAAVAVVIAGVQLVLIALSVSLAVFYGMRALRRLAAGSGAGKQKGRIMARFGIGFGIFNAVLLLLSFLGTLYAG